MLFRSCGPVSGLAFSLLLRLSESQTQSCLYVGRPFPCSVWWIEDLQGCSVGEVRVEDHHCLHVLYRGPNNEYIYSAQVFAAR